jgi:hypothetical protein
MHKKVVVALFGLLVMGAILGAAIFLYIAWQHNPQCEFHCDGVIHWENWLTVGAVGGGLGLLVMCPVVMLVALVVAVLLRKHT